MTARRITVVALCAAVVCAAACSSSRQRGPRAADNLIVRDVPSIFRSSIGAMATVGGIENTLVSGYGVVVGLNGTGGGTLDDRIAVSMERMMGLRGVGRANAVEGTTLQDPTSGLGMSPREMLRDPNVAVVLVQAAVPPGAPEGFEFDVYVRALNATSLDGGTLWTTDLRLGQPSVFGARQTRQIAEGRGPIFVNPFAEPGREGVSATQGRVLSGGVVTNPLEMTLLLDNASLTRARQIVTAVNSRFPEGPGDLGPTARGRDGSTIAIRIPAAMRDRPGDFVQIIRFLTVDQQFPEEYARRYVAAIESQPELAAELAWSLVGLGQKAIPFLRPLYTHPELAPKLAGLRAGSALGDPRVAEHAIDFAEQGPSSVLRAEACGMLGRLDGNPAIDRALQTLSTENDLQVRIAAYEALAERAERTQVRRLAANAAEGTLRTHADYERLKEVAEQYLPITGPQRIGRIPVAGKFSLDRVPGGDPLIYITQQGRPRIVLMGDSARLKIPMLVSTWSNRLMVTSDGVEGSEDESVRVYYRPSDGRPAVVQEGLGSSLAELARFFARTPTAEDPDPGLDLSYSEVVGALYNIHQEGATLAAFATERDRLLAGLIEATEGAEVGDRPEFEAGDVTFDPVEPEPGKENMIVPVPVEVGKPTLVVPIPPRETK